MSGAGGGRLPFPSDAPETPGSEDPPWSRAGSPTARARERVGKTVVGRFRLDHLLGVGGSAAVYAATVLASTTRVAVKILHPELSARDDLVRRFIREGGIARKLNHPALVPVFEDGRMDDGAVFLVMELLEGHTLERWVTYEERLPIIECMRIAEDVLDLLAAAHDAGIVHRDIKPANVFRTDKGDIRVLDFGIARFFESTNDGLQTQHGAGMGTPSYMPPEQARGRWNLVDGRTDLWAVGAVLFSLLTGEKPRIADTAHEELLLAMTQPVRSVLDAAPKIPTEVADVVDRALAFTMDDRFPSALAMQAALRTARALLEDASPASAPTRPDMVIPEKPDSGSVVFIASNLQQHRDEFQETRTVRDDNARRQALAQAKVPKPPPPPLAPPPRREDRAGRDTREREAREREVREREQREREQREREQREREQRERELRERELRDRGPVSRAPSTRRGGVSSSPVMPPTSPPLPPSTGEPATQPRSEEPPGGLTSLARSIIGYDREQKHVLIAAEGQSLFAFRLARRVVFWEHPIPDGPVWLATFGRALVVAAGKALSTVDLVSGEIGIRISLPRPLDPDDRVPSAPAILPFTTQQPVYVARSTGNTLISIHAGHGTILKERSFASRVEFASWQDLLLVLHGRESARTLEILDPITLETVMPAGRAPLPDPDSVVTVTAEGPLLLISGEKRGLFGGGAFVSVVDGRTMQEAISLRDKAVEPSVRPTLSSGGIAAALRSTEGDGLVALPGGTTAGVPLPGKRLLALTAIGTTLFTVLAGESGGPELASVDPATFAPRFAYGPIRETSTFFVPSVLGSAPTADAFVQKSEGRAIVLAPTAPTHPDARAVDPTTGGIGWSRSLVDVGLVEAWGVISGALVVRGARSLRVIDARDGTVAARF